MINHNTSDPGKNLDVARIIVQDRYACDDDVEVDGDAPVEWVEQGAWVTVRVWVPQYEIETEEPAQALGSDHADARRSDYDTRAIERRENSPLGKAIAAVRKVFP